MANYVHNYLFCDNEAKERILSLNSEDLYLLNGCYDKTVTPIEDDKFLIIFDTRGMEYRTEFITMFIKEFNGTKWYCIEESEIEQGHYFWNGRDVAFSKRRLVKTLKGKEICIKYSDSEYRPLRIMFISDNQIVFENLLKNEMKRYSFSGNVNLRINEYIGSLLDEVPRDFIVYSIPFKNEIERTVSIHWGDKICYIESFKETDDWELNVEDGENILDNMISLFNSFLSDEGIEEVVSFNLRNEI